MVKVNTSPSVAPEISKPEIKKQIKPISISISPKINNQSKDAVKTEVKQHESGIENESYTAADFEKAWKGFARTVPEIVSVVSYINNTFPEKIDKNTYELTFSNVFQENEFKKLLTELCFSIRKTLKNSSVNFITKVVETIEKDTNNNPEEILRKMTEQNPALQVLKKNLNLEID